MMLKQTRFKTLLKLNLVEKSIQSDVFFKQQHNTMFNIY